MLAEVLTIGDELLTGHTVDSNSAFIASKLVERGGLLGEENNNRRRRRRGDKDRYWGGRYSQGSLRSSHQRRLGPTHDDVTMLAVAEALGKKLILCEECLEKIKAFYERLYREGYIDDPSLNEGGRKKMAYLPEGAEPLENTEGGAAPGGAFIEHEGVKIFVLPGMPREMKAMLEKEVLPRLGRRKFLQRKFLAEITDESKLAPILREALKKFKVKIHSSPKGFGKYIG